MTSLEFVDILCIRVSWNAKACSLLLISPKSDCNTQKQALFAKEIFLLERVMLAEMQKQPFLVKMGLNAQIFDIFNCFLLCLMQKGI